MSHNEEEELVCARPFSGLLCGWDKKWNMEMVAGSSLCFSVFTLKAADHLCVCTRWSWTKTGEGGPLRSKQRDRRRKENGPQVGVRPFTAPIMHTIIGSKWAAIILHFCQMCVWRPRRVLTWRILPSLWAWSVESPPGLKSRSDSVSLGQDKKLGLRVWFRAGINKSACKTFSGRFEAETSGGFSCRFIFEYLKKFRS